jgi:DNA polymerase III epsilon subunit-like protein
MTVKQKQPIFGMCIDWETTGIDWNNPTNTPVKYQGISFGLVIFRFKNFEIVDTLYREIKFVESEYKWDDSAEKIHGLSREHLEANGISQEDALCDFIEFTEPYFGSPLSNVWLMGHHIDFDIRMTDHLFKKFGIELPFDKFFKLDTVAASMIAFGDYKSEALFQRLGFEERTTHNALEDAIKTVEAAQAIHALVQIGLGEI